MPKTPVYTESYKFHQLTRRMSRVPEANWITTTSAFWGPTYHSAQENLKQFGNPDVTSSKWLIRRDRHSLQRLMQSLPEENRESRDFESDIWILNDK